MSHPSDQKSIQALSQPVLWLMTIASGLVVANNYYNQPLLGLMAKEFDVSESTISIIPMLTQVGYALGLLLIVPLGDMLKRKRLIMIDFVCVIISLLGIALAPNINWLFPFSLLVGFTSVLPQIFVPMAAEFSEPEKQSSAIGLVMSGLLLGILLSRVISGVVGDWLGWRAMYGIGMANMVVLAIFVYKMLPDVPPNFKGNYRELMRSLVYLTKSQPVLRLASFRGAMAFAGFSAFWTLLVFHLEEAPFYAGPSIAGSFGIIGAVGALAAAWVGKLAKTISPYKIILYSLILMLLSWVTFYFGGYSYLGLILGIIFLDLGLQSMHIMNQSAFFSLNIGASNRLNTVYMFSYFMGGSIGTFVAAKAWVYYQWEGVVLTGAIFTLSATIAHIAYKKKKRQPGNLYNTDR